MPISFTKKTCTKVKILIVDDELDDQMKLTRIINEVSNLLKITANITSINSLEQLNMSYHDYDLIFLDIIFNNSSNINGINVAKRLTALNPYCNIVFTTINKNFIMEAFKAKPISYIVKPCTKASVIDVFNTFNFRNSYSNYKIEFGKMSSEILYSANIILIESDNHKSLCYYFNNENQLCIKHFNTSLVSWNELIELKYFVKISNYAIVNMNFINEFTKNYINFHIIDKKLTISRRSYNEFKVRYYEYKTFGGNL